MGEIVKADLDKLRGDIAERLTSLRKGRKLKQAEVTTALGVNSPSTYSMYELCRNTLTVEVLVKASDFYGVSADYILGRSDRKEKADTYFAAWSEQNSHLPYMGHKKAAALGETGRTGQGKAGMSTYRRISYEEFKEKYMAGLSNLDEYITKMKERYSRLPDHRQKMAFVIAFLAETHHQDSDEMLEYMLNLVLPDAHTDALIADGIFNSNIDLAHFPLLKDILDKVTGGNDVVPVN